jgi:hypothetical protein
VCNLRDERIPWVKKLGHIISTQDQITDPSEPLAAAGLYDEAESQTFKFWQTVNRRSIQDLVHSRSTIAVLDDETRAAKLTEVLELYDDYGRGMDGMQLPYVTRCFRARVLDRAEPEATEDADPDLPPATVIDDGVLLIDFR